MKDTRIDYPLLAGPRRPEARLLLCCARTVIGPDLATEMRSLAAGMLDWEFLCAAAEKHRLTQLLFRNLSAICSESIPEAISIRLRHQFHGNAGSNLRLARALADLVRTFRAEGIPVIAFKGSVLASSAYGKLALRQFYDVDLFIRQQDLERSHRLLIGQGYGCEELFDQEARYRRTEGAEELDLHWGFAPRYFHLTVSADELFARARPDALLDQPVLTFSPEDLLEILCLQVIKDSWERLQRLEHLSKVCDIAEHLRANPGLDWSRVVESAGRKGVQRIVHCALLLAGELLGAGLPPDVQRRIDADPGARNCARRMCRPLFTVTDRPAPLHNPYLAVGLRLRQLAFYLGIRERRRDRLRHLGEVVRLSVFSPRSGLIRSGEPTIRSKDRSYGAHR